MPIKEKLLIYIIAFAQSGNSSTGLSGFLNNIYTDVSNLAWGIFILAWVIGAVLRGSPLPFKFKKGGDDLLTDAAIGALLVAIGTTVFSFIKALGHQI